MEQDDKFRFVEQITRAHFYAPFGVVHYARNLALPLGEPRGRCNCAICHNSIKKRSASTLMRSVNCLTNAAEASAAFSVIP